MILWAIPSRREAPSFLCTQQQMQRGKSHVWALRLHIHSTNISSARPCARCWWASHAVSVLNEHTANTGGSYWRASLSLSLTFGLFPTHEPHMPSGTVIGIWCLDTMFMICVLHLDMIWWIEHSELCSVEAPILASEPEKLSPSSFSWDSPSS